MKSKGKATPRGVILRKPQDARRFLSRLLNGLYKEELEPDQARALFYGVSILLKTFEICDLSERIDRLEEEATRHVV